LAASSNPLSDQKIPQLTSAGDIKVTNDGATILGSIMLDNGAVKILVNISKLWDDEVGDGATSVYILAVELLRADCDESPLTDHRGRVSDCECSSLH